jgi:hypothetical protein
MLNVPTGSNGGCSRPIVSTGVRGVVTRLSGRCSCGVARELAAIEPDEHLRCEGKKRCRACDQVKAVDEFYRGGQGGIEGSCKRCKAARDARRKRERYATDPLFREYRLGQKGAAYWADPDVWRLKQRTRDAARRDDQRARVAARQAPLHQREGSHSSSTGKGAR